MLPIGSELAARLSAGADAGLDLAAVVKIEWPAPVGARWYATRRLTLAGGIVCEPKVAEWPATARARVPGVLEAGAINESVTIRMVNTPEKWDGSNDSARISELMTMAPLEGALVWVGVVDPRDAGLADQVKWDNAFRVDTVTRTAQGVEIYATDILLQPGEGPAGWPVSGAEFPNAPPESLGVVRGAVFGKVEGVPLIPIDVGRASALADEIDEWDGVIELSGSIEEWDAAGYAWIDAEMVRYDGVDRNGKRLLNVQRGVGWPGTTPAAHGAGARVRETTTGFVSTLAAAIDASQATIGIAEVAGFPTVGRIVVDGEAIDYTGKSGGNLTGCVRGRAIPTYATTHDAGTVVRTIPVEAGVARYRYLVGRAPVAAVTNIRGLDESSNEVPVDTGAVVTSVFTSTRGRAWAVVDLTERVKLERFSQGVSQVPEEWIKETDGRYDPATGYAMWDGFKRWTVTAASGAAVKLQAGLVLDPQTSAQAAVLESVAGKNVLGLAFDAGFGVGLDPRVVAGRFKGARVEVQAQYSKESATRAVVEILKDGAVVKSAVVEPPKALGVAGGGVFAVSGNQKLPRSRWTGGGVPWQKVALGMESAVVTSPDTNLWYWTTVTTDFAGGFSCAASPRGMFGDDPAVFVAGAWFANTGKPALYPWSPDPLLNNGLTKAKDFDLRLAAPSMNWKDTNKPFERLRLVINMPSGIPAPGLSKVPYGVHLFAGVNMSGVVTKSFYGEFAATAGEQIAEFTMPAGVTQGQVLSIRVVVGQYDKRIYLNGGSVIISSMRLEIAPESTLEGAVLDTNVAGTNFFVDLPATQAAPPSWWQTLSIGGLARSWARARGVDAWDFFRGLEVRMTMPMGAGDLKLAWGDCNLEIEYAAPETVYDLPIIADVNGRVGTPAGGGADVVLENPVDVLAAMVDGAEFFGLAGRRDASWGAARAACEWMRLSRVVNREMTVRELAATLCHETGLVLLLDGGQIGVRVRDAWPSAATAVVVLGDEAGRGHEVTSDAFPVAGQVEEFRNEIGIYYRRNLYNEWPRAVVEVRDQVSIAVGGLGLRREALTWDWHQSARGYAGGFDEQKAAVTRLANFILQQAAHLWDYATIEIPLMAGEALQRMDNVVLHRPRTGYFGMPARVVAWERLARPLRNRLVVQASSSAARYLWQGLGRLGDLRDDTFIRLVRGGREMEFVLKGVRVAALRENGDLVVKGGLVVVTSAMELIGYQGQTGTPENAAVRWQTEGTLDFYLPLASGADAGQAMHALQMRPTGDLVLYPNFAASEYPWALRDVAAGGVTGDGVAESGITSVAGATAGAEETRFACGGAVQMVVTRGELRLRGNLILGVAL